MVGQSLDEFKSKGHNYKVDRIAVEMRRKADKQFQMVRPRDLEFGWGVLGND